MTTGTAIVSFFKEGIETTKLPRTCETRNEEIECKVPYEMTTVSSDTLDATEAKQIADDKIITGVRDKIVSVKSDPVDGNKKYNKTEFDKLVGSTAGSAAVGKLGGVFQCYEASAKILGTIKDRTERLVARFQSAVCAYKPPKEGQLMGVGLLNFFDQISGQIEQENGKTSDASNKLEDFDKYYQALSAWKLKGKSLEANDKANGDKPIDLPSELLDEKLLDEIEGTLGSYEVKEKETTTVRDTSPDGRTTTRLAETEKKVTKNPLKEEFHFIRLAVVRAINSGKDPRKLTWDQFKVLCGEVNGKYQEQFKDKIEKWGKGYEELSADNQMWHGANFLYAYIVTVGAYKEMVRGEKFGETKPAEPNKRPTTTGDSHGAGRDAEVVLPPVGKKQETGTVGVAAGQVAPPPEATIPLPWNSAAVISSPATPPSVASAASLFSPPEPDRIVYVVPPGGEAVPYLVDRDGQMTRVTVGNPPAVPDPLDPFGLGRIALPDFLTAGAWDAGQPHSLRQPARRQVEGLPPRAIIIDSEAAKKGNLPEAGE